jgi:hypothetical protein
MHLSPQAFYGELLPLLRRFRQVPS